MHAEVCGKNLNFLTNAIDMYMLASAKIHTAHSTQHTALAIFLPETIFQVIFVYNQNHVKATWLVTFSLWKTSLYA